MGRRLVKHGESTLMVSLPAKWLKRHGYKKGDEVEIAESGDGLMIGAARQQTSKKATFTLKPAGIEAYRSILGGYYRQGFDELEIRFRKKSFADVQTAVDSLYGFEITDFSETSCRAMKVFREQGTEPQAHLRKIIFAIRSMQKLIMSDLQSGHKESGNELLQLRNSVLKERDLIGRLAAKDTKTISSYAIALNLWNAARCYHKMHIHADKIEQRHLLHLKNACHLFEIIFPDKGRADIDRCDRLYRQYLREANGCIREGGPIITYTIMIILLIQSCLSHAHLGVMEPA